MLPWHLIVFALATLYAAWLLRARPQEPMMLDPEPAPRILAGVLVLAPDQSLVEAQCTCDLIAAALAHGLWHVRRHIYAIQNEMAIVAIDN